MTTAVKLRLTVTNKFQNKCSVRSKHYARLAHAESQRDSLRERVAAGYARRAIQCLKKALKRLLPTSSMCQLRKS
jgi:hypothetical protein